MGSINRFFLSAALALLGILGIGLGIGVAGASVANGIARQPEAAGQLIDFYFNYVLIPEFILALLLVGISLLLIFKGKSHKG
ncbi:hypothetical protein [Bacillus thermotolerans]|uniref:hypothetical protein n=1 Tax=Bacillus thermotolerans TaxID=1221996 RepID=UPI00057EA401|nr:hypothetical protein [Bacillus thermotolerans]KKB41103.1 hypothetical protein QY96_02123 [Bacillus thermotolerans]